MKSIKRYTKIKRPEAKLRLIFLHHAGGSAPMYLNWGAALPESVEVSSLQLPGRGEAMRLPSFDNIDLAAKEVAEILAEEVEAPYAIFGHSLGALIGFEAIRYLEKNKMKTPMHFIASGLAAPHQLRPKWRRDLMPKQELIDLIASYDKGKVNQSAMYFEFIETMLPTSRNDFKMHDDYHFTPGDLLSCPITAVCGVEDETHSEEGVKAWGELTRNHFSYKMFPGGHMFITDQQVDFLKWLNEQVEFILNP